MAVQTKKQLFTVEDYYKMADLGIIPERGVELLNGKIIYRDSISAEQAGTIRRMNYVLSKILINHAIISVLNPIRINDFSEPEPNISILKPAPDFYTAAHPTPEDVYLLIEVADTSVLYKQEVKLPLYANAGIAEVWIVNLKKRVIEIYREPKEGEYQSQTIVADDAAIYVAVFDKNIEVSALLG